MPQKVAPMKMAESCCYDSDIILEFVYSINPSSMKYSIKNMKTLTGGQILNFKKSLKLEISSH